MLSTIYLEILTLSVLLPRWPFYVRLEPSGCRDGSRPAARWLPLGTQVAAASAARTTLGCQTALVPVLPKRTKRNENEIYRGSQFKLSDLLFFYLSHNQ